ncbi:HTH-type transcriptional regulator GltC [Xylophilus ampelinus]|nr:LysR family transcriptional regulator [Variovorax sp.]VTY31728.1 HTH-type transcriptional regulator GltC [Xylophilus ampelinus]
MNTTFAPTIRQLRAFVQVHRLGKLGAAAEQLFVTQSAVSMLIRQLEDGLDARLFDRTTRSLQPTAAASEMLPVAERILRDVDALSTGFRELAQLERGRVSVAITPTLASFLLPEAIRAFARSHPQVRVLVDDCAPDQFVSRVIGEHVDFGIGTPERPGAEVDTQMLLRDHLALVCPRTHPLAARRSVRWRALAGEPLTTVRPGYGIRPQIEAAAARAGVALDVVHEVSFLSTALWMTASGMGAAIMPSAFARAAGDASLAILPLVGPRVSRDVSVVTRRGRSLSAASLSFIRTLRTTLAAHKV